MLRQETCNERFLDFAPPEHTLDGKISGLESRFEIHHDNQVELKLDYAVDEQTKWTRYQTEAFIFVPRSLGITPGTYDVRQFFSDTQAYIRFQTPKMCFSQVLDHENTSSPLERLRRVAAQNAIREESCHQELRMLGCLMKANLRDMVVAADKKLNGLSSKATGQELRIRELSNSILEFINEAGKVCEQFRDLRPAFVGISNSARSLELFERTDEFLSLSVESYLTELLSLLQNSRLRQKRKLRQLTDGLWTTITKTVEREQIHRRDCGFATLLDTEDGRTTFTTRASSLKKFITSVLFLKISEQKEGTNFLQIVSGIAAALAMVFSLSTAFLSDVTGG